MEAFLSSIKDQIFQALEMPADKILWPGFAHISVVAGPTGFADYVGEHLGFPIGSPFSEAATSNCPPKLPLRSHRLNIGAIDLQVITSWLPGELTTDFSFSGGAN